MRAVILKDGTLQLETLPAPECKTGEVLIRVSYAGINHADLLQKKGRYPLPQNPAVPGMEISGIVEAFASDVKGFTRGEHVCALLSQGGYAELVSAPAPLVFKLPDAFSLMHAAALLEAAFTAWISLVWQGRIQKGEAFLMHGGASSIGIIAIQIANVLGARVFATAGSTQKCALCVELGAQKAINYKQEEFVGVIKALTGDKGVDVIMDMVGGDYFDRNLDALAVNGRLCMIAFMKGAKLQTNLGPILLKRLSVMGSTLRSRPLAEKTHIAQELRKTVWPAVLDGRIKPVIDQIFPLENAEKALFRMDQGLNCGKILLKCETSPPD